MPARHCYHKSLMPLMEEVREQMGSGPVYISFDIDALDPSFAPGTGASTPWAIKMCHLILVLNFHNSACRRKWRLSDTDLCPCGKTQTISHIVESCPLTKLNGSLSRLHSVDEDAVSWLTSYG